MFSKQIFKLKTMKYLNLSQFLTISLYLIFLFSVGTLSAIPSPIISYPMNQTPDATPNAILDATGNTTGTLDNVSGGLPTLIAGANANTQSAWDFSPTAGYIRVASNATTAQLGDITATDGITIGFWANFNYNTTYIFRRLSGIGNVFDIMMNGAGVEIRFQDPNYVITSAATDGVFDGTWHHIAVTFDFTSSTNNLILYLDGQVINTKSYSVANSFNSTVHDLIIGARASGDARHYSGQMDEYVIFDEALSAADVLELYNGSNNSCTSSLVDILYPMNQTPDAAPNAILDETGNTTGTLDNVSGGLPTLVAGANANTQSAWDFGPTTGYIRVASDATTAKIGDIATTDGITIGFWANFNYDASYIYRRLSGMGNVFDIMMTNGGIEVRFQDPNYTIGNTPADDVFDGTWQHIAVTFDFTSSTNNLILYLDGQVINTKSYSVAASFNSTVADLIIGARSSGDARHYPGQLDEYAIATRALSASEILDLYNSSNCSPTTVTKNDEILSLDPYYFDDFETLKTNDFSSDLSTHSTIEWYDNNRPNLVAGPKGNAIDLHGVDAAFRAHSYGNYKLGNFPYSTGFSCSFWINHLYDHAADANDRIFAQHTNFQLRYSNGLHATFNNQSQQIVGTQALDGAWHHIVIVADFDKTSNNVTAYMDNAPIGTFTYDFAGGFSDADSRRSFYIGKRDINTNFAEAILDEVALFNRPLSAYEVNQLYQVNTIVEANPTIKTLQINNGKTITTEGASTQVNLSATTNIASPTTITWSVVQGNAQIQTNGSLSTTIDLSDGASYQHAKIRLTVGDGNHSVSSFINVVRVAQKAAGVRSLSAMPAVGVHPRILFSPSDLPDLRSRFTSVSYIQDGINYQLPISQPKAVADRTSFDYMVLSYNALMADDQSALNQLATEFTAFVTLQDASYAPAYDVYLVHDVDMYIAFVYDFLFNNMTTAQQDTVRSFIARMIAHRTCYGGFGQGLELIHYTTNWTTHHDNIVVCAAAIEGEAGEMPEILIANENKMRNFLCQNGVRESGFPREGMGYYGFGMEQAIYSCIIHARRGENFFETSNFHKSLEIGLREEQPWLGGNMYSHHDGQWWGNGFYTGNMLWVAKYMYPNDILVDHHVQNFADNYSEARKQQLATMVFGMPMLGGNENPGAVGLTENLPTTAVDLNRGIINTRSKWGDDMVRFDFECRMDLYNLGHIHSGRNMFTLSGHGRQWISDNGYHDTKSDEHATVLIDGLAYDCGNRSIWPSAPGILLRYEDENDYMLAQGDATFAYNYAQNGTVNVNKTWADFSFPGATIPAWKSEKSLPNMVELEVVEKAKRTVVFKKGDYPFALIVDDIKKDANTHEYEWVANVPHNPSDQMNFLFDTPIKTNDELLLRYKTDTQADAPQLLVQLLDADGTPQAFDLIMRDIGTYEKESNPSAVAMRHMISLKRNNVVEPRFKMLLYSHRAGDPMPQTSWNADKSLLTVSIGDEVTFIEFTEDNMGCIVVNIGGVELAVKVLLQGPLSGSTMNNGIQTILPTVSPYTSAPATMTTNALASSDPNDAIVDWVLLELRDATDNTQVVAKRSALLQRDGDVVDMDGQSPVKFSGINAGTYHVVVKHRNHLGVMTAMPINLN